MQKNRSTENNNKSLHRKLFQEFRQQALSAPSGSRFPSEQIISRRYHISRSTVSRVYNELEAAGYLVRKQGSGTFIPETPLYRICYLLPFDDISNNHDMELVRRGEALRKRCEALAIPFEYIDAATNTRNNRELNSEQFKQISKNTVLVIGGYYFRSIFNQLIRQNTNVVFISAQHELDVLYKERLKMWQLIEIDRRGGMVKLISEMARQGCKKIALLHDFPHYQHPLLRGYRLGLHLNKLEYKPQLTINMIGGVEYVQRRLDTLFEFKSIYGFDGIIILAEHLAQTVSKAWKNMKYPEKDQVKMAVVSKTLPLQRYCFDVLHLHQPSADAIVEYIMTASALNSPPFKRIVPMEMTRLLADKSE